MAITINADTSNGLVMTPDTSGQIKLQAGGADIATVSSTGIAMAAGKTLPAASLTGTAPFGVMPVGSILQVVTNRTDARTVYSGSNEYIISELTTTIVPKSASSLLIIDMHISYEANDVDQTFKATKDGLVMTASGYEGYNSVAGNNRWSGIAAMQYDGNNASTLSHIALRYFDAAGSTASRTYGMNARTSSSTNQTWYLNRCVTNSGADTIENGVSFVTITEIAQ